MTTKKKRAKNYNFIFSEVRSTMKTVTTAKLPSVINL